MVVDENVVWVCDPEASRSLISVEETHRSHGFHDQVSIHEVVGLNCVLNKYCVTFDLERNILNKSQVMSSMECECSVETLVHCQSFSI